MANTDGTTTANDRDVAALKALIAALGGRDRKARQSSAHMVAEVAKAAPAAVLPFVDEVVAAIGRPEAQTRWEALDALTSLIVADPDAASKGFEGAEDCLYDEESGLLRLTAFRYFTTLGSSSPEWSAKAWPLIDEAIQCYHGDPEFDDMLDALYAFAQSDLDEGVRAALTERMSFDARNGRGSVVARARQIVDVLR